MPNRPFIVAEVSKNWNDGAEVDPERGLLAEQFETVIMVNLQRGYRLMSFQIHRMIMPTGVFNETIIAVFEEDSEYELA